MSGSRIYRILQAWWHSLRSHLQTQVSVSDQQFQQQQQQKQQMLARAAAQQQLGLLEAEKRRCQQQLQKLATAFLASETAAKQALQQQDEAKTLTHLWQLAEIEQQQQATERQLARLNEQLCDNQLPEQPAAAEDPTPLTELQQLALQASAARHLQRLKAQGCPQ